MYLEKYDISFETCKNNKENDIDKSNKENVHLKLTVTKNSRSESFGKFWRWLSMLLNKSYETCSEWTEGTIQLGKLKDIRFFLCQ